MKKLIALPLIFSLAAPVSADFLGIYGGVGIWNAGLDGDVGVESNPITGDELGLERENNATFYVAFEHPVPVIPNIRLSHTQAIVKGEATISSSFQLDNDIQVIEANSDTVTEIDLSHTDLTLYYEILDLWVSADIGLTARSLDGYAEVAWTNDSTESGPQSGTEKSDLGIVLPLLYGRAQFDLPFSGWYAGGTLQYISVSNNTLSDAEARIGYLGSGLGLDFGVEFGYRRVALVTEEVGDLIVDLTLDGPYAQLVFHF